MTKYFCDFCGKEVKAINGDWNYYKETQFRSRGVAVTLKLHDTACATNHRGDPSAPDICVECRSEILMQLFNLARAGVE